LLKLWYIVGSNGNIGKHGKQSEIKIGHCTNISEIVEKRKWHIEKKYLDVKTTLKKEQKAIVGNEGMLLRNR